MYKILTLLKKEWFQTNIKPIVFHIGVNYKFQWYKLSAPKKSHGYMEGKDQSRLDLTKVRYQTVPSVCSTLGLLDRQDLLEKS